MKLIHTLCCNALINPFYHMVEPSRIPFPQSMRFLSMLSYLLAGGTLAEVFGAFAAYISMEDSQAAGMITHIIMQHLSNYFLACSFILLSLSNILIRRGAIQLKPVRLFSFASIIAVASKNFLIVPRMDYLSETALQDGMPVMLSPFANYFAILNGILLILLCIQISSSLIIAWRLSAE